MATTVITQTTAIYLVTGNEYAGTIGETVNTYDGYNNTLPGTVSEVCGTADAFTLTEATAIINSFMMQDGTGFGGVYFSHRADSFTASTHSSLTLFAAILEAIYGFDPTIVSANTSSSIGDVLTARAFLQGMYTRFLSDSFTATPALSGAIGLILESLCRFFPATVSQLTGQSAVQEVCGLVGRLLLALNAPISETLTVAATETAYLLLRMTAAERIMVMQAALVSMQTSPAIQELMAVTALMYTSHPATVIEPFTVTQTLATLAYLTAKRAELITATATAIPVLRLLITVADSVMLIDPPTGQTFDPQQLLQALIQDQVSFGIGYIASNGIWTGWTLNATTQAVSNYAGWDFNSFTKFRGQYLGASNTQGIASLGGADDGTAAITATLQSAVTDFGNSFLKRVKMAYIGMNANGTATFSTTTDDNVERVYQLVPDAPGLHTERVQLARGVMSRYWTFTLKAVGADFRIDEISLLPVTLERRI